MHEPMIRILNTSGASILNGIGAPAQSIGPLIVALLGLVLLGILVYRLLFKTVTENSAGLERFRLADPRPSDALDSRPKVVLLASYRRSS